MSYVIKYFMEFYSNLFMLQKQKQIINDYFGGSAGIHRSITIIIITFKCLFGRSFWLLVLHLDIRTKRMASLRTIGY